MSDRPVPGLTAIVVITMLVAAGCAGAPETEPTDVVTPDSERVEPAVVEDGADTEPRPDPGIAHVTVTPPRSDFVLPLPVIELTGTPEGGRVDSGLVAPVPDLSDSSTRTAMPPAVPELPAMGERLSTDDLATADNREPADDREPPRQSPVAADPGPVIAGAPTTGLALRPDPAQTDDGELADAPEPVDAPEPAGNTEPATAAEPAGGQDRRAGPTSPREERGPTAAGITAAPPSPVVTPPENGDADSNPPLTAAAPESADRDPPSTATAPEPADTPAAPTAREGADIAGVTTAREGADTRRAATAAEAVRNTDTPGVAPVFSEEPQITRNTRTVPAESEIEVRLPGVSWLFLGGEPPVTFLGRETDPDADETLFRFRVPGAAQLRFEAQDLATGARTRHEETVEITAGDREDPTAAVRIAEGDRSVRSGQATETPRRSDDNSTDEVTPPTDGSTGSDGADELTYLDYFRDQEQPFDPDHHALIVAAIGNDDDALGDVSSDDLLSYADRVLDQGNPAAVRDLLQVMWASRQMKSDEVLYRLARLAETEGPTRDLRRARELYSQLVDGYPFSVHYRDSEERIRFLNRHFFHIR